MRPPLTTERETVVVTEDSRRLRVSLVPDLSLSFHW
jgi:hypothetical protein